MHIRTLHHYMSESCPVYWAATAPVLWLGRQVTSLLPEGVRRVADRIAFAFELIVPKIAVIAATGYFAYASGRQEAALALVASLMWSAHDLANLLQFYPYDYLEDLAGVDFKKERETIKVREDLLDRIVFYLTKPSSENNNVLTVGPAGSGKTSAAFALAKLIESKECPPALKGSKVYRVRLDKMMANAPNPGDFEMRFLTILQALALENNAIIFIDEAHQLLDRRGHGGTSLANLLKPYLSGGMRCLAATTIKEYGKRIAEDEGFEQRFNLVEMPPLEDATCTDILQSKFPGLTLIAAQTAMKEAQRLYPQRALPRSAVILLENTQHRTKKVPTPDSIRLQAEYERASMGSLNRPRAPAIPISPQAVVA